MATATKKRTAAKGTAKRTAVRSQKMSDIRRDPVIKELAAAVSSVSKPAGVWDDYVRLFDSNGKTIAWACKRNGYTRLIKLTDVADKQLKGIARDKGNGIHVTAENVAKVKAGLKKAAAAA